MFELRLNNKIIPLKWGTWAMKRFCELENKTLVELINVLSSGNYDLSTIVNIISAAAESGYKSLQKPIDFDEYIICEWIDEVGGLSAKEGQLIAFMKYMQDSMTPDLQETKKEAKKKIGFYSWDSLLILAIEVGLTINEFWQLSWREFLLYNMAYQNKEVKEWERVRTLSYMIYLSNTSDKSPKSLKSFMPLPSDIDENEDEPKLTNEELQRTLSLYGVK